MTIINRTGERLLIVQPTKLYTTDAQSYFQDWAQAKRKEMQDMEKSMRENPLYQKEVNPMDDDETWSERFHFILRKGLSEKEWKAYQKGIRKDRLQIWAVFMNENPDYDYHYFLNMLKFNSNELCMI